jgi:hypothetical protein
MKRLLLLALFLSSPAFAAGRYKPHGVVFTR